MSPDPDKLYFKCPHCRRVMSTQRWNAGKDSKCLGCERSIQIPSLLYTPRKERLFARVSARLRSWLGRFRCQKEGAHCWGPWHHVSVSSCQQQRECTRCHNATDTKTDHAESEALYCAAGSCLKVVVCLREGTVLERWTEHDWESTDSRAKCKRCGVPGRVCPNCNEKHVTTDDDEGKWFRCQDHGFIVPFSQHNPKAWASDPQLDSPPAVPCTVCGSNMACPAIHVLKVWRGMVEGKDVIRCTRADCSGTIGYRAGWDAASQLLVMRHLVENWNMLGNDFGLLTDAVRELGGSESPTASAY